VWASACVWRCPGALACACACVHADSLTQHATRMHHIATLFVAPLAASYFSTLSHKWRSYGKQFIEYGMCVWFSLQLLSKTFLILIIIQRNIAIIVKKRVRVKCPLFLSNFNENLNFLDGCWKKAKYQISSKSVQWASSCSMRTDEHDEANSHFSQFCEKRLKKAQFATQLWVLFLTAAKEGVLYCCETTKNWPLKLKLWDLTRDVKLNYYR
jgi:hypothetical protein